MKNKVRLISVGISLIFLIAGIVFDKGFGIDWFPVYAALYGAAVIAAGWSVFYKAFRNIARGQIFDENFLMLIAAAGAFTLGLVWRESGEEMMDSVLVMMLYQVGEFFQSLAVGKSRKGIKALLSVRPDSALVIRDGKEYEVFPDEIAVGETVVVKPGQRVAVDGTLVGGAGYVDTSAVTGESAPVYAQSGDAVISGSISKDGLLYIKADKLFGESTVSRMLKMVEEAADKKSREESFITKFAKIYTPVVVLVAVLVAVLPPLFTGMTDGAVWGEWIYSALALLVISCPCALVISVPVTFFGGIGGMAKKGVLVKGGNSFLPLKKTTTVVFDKTGTLTSGKFSIKEVKTADEKLLIQMAAAAEKHFTHPIAQSVVQAAEKYGDNPFVCDNVLDVSGKGIKAVIGGKEFLAGNRAMLVESGIVPEEIDTPFTAVYCAYDGQYAGVITVGDTIKKDAYDAVSRLKNMGLKTVMLSGDRQPAAEAVAKELGLDEYYAGLLPEDKVKRVQEMIAAGEKVLFVGDGLNDAPVLALSDVGAAMGGLGSDATIEASDLVIMNDTPSSVATAITHAKKVIRVATENIWGTLLFKVLVLVLAVTKLSPGLWFAIIADVGVSIVAVLNAMRTMNVGRRLDKKDQTAV